MTRPKTFAIKNYGCQMNAYDGARMADLLAAEGLALAAQDEADLVVPVAALGAAYAGGRPLVSLARHHAVQERRAGTLRELSRAMRADDAPFGAIGF